MLYLTQLKVPSYPERNFGGNQLLDSSISLSPLYPDLTSDLHVSIESNVHQGFPWLPSAQEKFAIFRVPANVLNFRSFSRTIRTEFHCTDLKWPGGGVTFISRCLVSITKTLAHSVDSLVRVSRRVIRDQQTPARRCFPNRTTCHQVQRPASVEANALFPDGTPVCLEPIRLSTNPASTLQSRQRLPLRNPRGTAKPLQMKRDRADHLSLRICREPSYPCRPAMSETFHSFFKGLFIFRLRYLFALGLGAIFSLRRNTPAFLCSSLKLHDSEERKGFWGLARRTYRTIAFFGESFLSCFIRLPGPHQSVLCTTIPRIPIPSSADSSIGFALFTRRY